LKRTAALKPTLPVPNGLHAEGDQRSNSGVAKPESAPNEEPEIDAKKIMGEKWIAVSGMRRNGAAEIAGQ
jgi:hypothetical protein